MKLITLILTLFTLQNITAKEVGVRIESISCDYVSSGSRPEINIKISPGYKFKGKKFNDFIKRPKSDFCLDLSEFEGQIVSLARFEVYRKKYDEYTEAGECYEIEYTYLKILIKSSHSSRRIDGYTLLETQKRRPLQNDYCVDSPY